MQTPRFTKVDFDRAYPDEDTCLEKIFQLRYSNTELCPKCSKAFRYHRLRGKKLYSCQFCGHNIAPTADTIYHKSSTPLRSWFYAQYLFSVSKNGVSAKELERHLGVTYKTAWRIASHVRTLFEQLPNAKLSNIVEVDETYIGGKKKGGKRGRGSENKTPVVGAVQRKGEMVAAVTKNTKSSALLPFIRNNVKIGSHLCTDTFSSYRKAKKEYIHSVVNHAAEEWKRGDTHTNTIEGFWSQMKRSIDGTYHSVSPKYLQRYVNEFVWRYNRKNSLTPLFSLLLERVAPKA